MDIYFSRTATYLEVYVKIYGSFISGRANYLGKGRYYSQKYQFGVGLDA